MAKKKSKPTYNDIEFDSKEEREFFWWCEEARELGILTQFRYQHPTYTLSETVKTETPRFGARGQSIKPSVRTLLGGNICR